MDSIDKNNIFSISRVVLWVVVSIFPMVTVATKQKNRDTDKIPKV